MLCADFRRTATVCDALRPTTVLSLVAVPAHFRSLHPVQGACAHLPTVKLGVDSMSDLAAAAAAAGCPEAAAAMAAAATAPGRDTMQCDGITGKLGARIDQKRCP